MHLFKITALTVLCLFNVGLFGQDQQPHVKQLEYDITTWSVRAKVTEDIKMWALSGAAAFTLGAFVIGAFKRWAHCRFDYWGYGTVDLAYSVLNFGSKFFGCALLLDLCASKYATGIVRELEKHKDQLLQNQQNV